MYPRMTILDVDIVLDHSNVVVTTHGDTPLFKSEKFEIAMKKWLKNEFNNVKKAIKDQLKKLEKNLWNNIPFEYKGIAGTLVSSLSDKFNLTPEYLEFGITSELEGIDHGEFASKLRRIKPEFSENPEFK